MEEGLGALGFWVFLGLILAAGTVSGALGERGKEREKQALLRALLEKEGNSVTEVLAYLREKDAAEAAANARVYAWFARVGRRVASLAMGIFAVWLGAAVRFVLLRDLEPVFLPLVAMIGIWAAGLTIAWRLWPSGKQKNDAHPDA